jgi:biopolymer transport protein ExbD
MNWKALLPLVLFIGTSAAQAQQSPSLLYVLPNGPVRFEQGAEIDIEQLGRELQKMSTEANPPEIRVKLDAHPNYGLVMMVLGEFADLGYPTELVGEKTPN